jgi:hypothetical protein
MVLGYNYFCKTGFNRALLEIIDLVFLSLKEGINLKSESKVVFLRYEY